MTSGEVRAGTKLGHRPGLDGLRGVAVLLVVAAHLGVPGFAGGGLVGVTLFFGLSGFLICTILLDEERISLARFYQRRALRLVPALVVVVAVWSFIDWQLGVGAVGHHARVALLYLSDFERARGGDVGSLRHTWSLAIEEQFYLLIPLLLVVFRDRLRLVAGLLVAAVVFVVWQRTRLAMGGSFAHAEFGIDARGDAIAIGCILAIVTFRRAVTVPPHWVLTAGLALAAATLIRGYPSPFLASLLLAAVACPVLVLWATTTPRLLAGRVLGWCGRRSYGIYLWHVPIVAQVPNPLLAVALTLLAVVTSWRYVEEPALRLRRHRPEVHHPMTDRAVVGPTAANRSSTRGAAAPLRLERVSAGLGGGER